MGVTSKNVPPRPPLGYYRGDDGRLYRCTLPLEQRLKLLRKRSLEVVNEATTICMLVVLPMLIAMVSPLFSGVDLPIPDSLLEDTTAIGFLLVAALVALTLFVYWLLRLYLNRWRLRCKLDLAATQLAVTVADDQYWRQVFDLQRDSPWLKWAQVAPPKTIEQQLEFAAAYYVSLQRLRSRTRALTGCSVARGNCTWHADRPACYVCGRIAAISFFPFLPYCYLALANMLARAGRLAALCDFFLGDVE